MSDKPIVKLIHNPWKDFLDDNVVIQSLQTAAIAGASLIEAMKDELSPEQDSFAIVILDPTRPTDMDSQELRPLADIRYGPNAGALVKNAVAKADIRRRFPDAGDDFVANNIHCLSPGDFAWDGSVEYLHTPAGGSGFSVAQDFEVTYTVTESFINSIVHKLREVIADLRSHGSHGWFSDDNTPGLLYYEFRLWDGLTVDTGNATT